MRQRAPLLVLLGSALAFLASLYLPWQAGPRVSCGPGCLIGAFTATGWSSGIGDAAALVALALAAATAAALANPGLLPRVPLGRCGIAVGYFAAAVAVALHWRGGLLHATSSLSAQHLHWAYGGYLGIAGAGLLLCAVAAIRGREVSRPPSVPTLASVLLGLGLLVSFLLPWHRFGAAGRAGYSLPGIVGATAVLAAVAVCFGGGSLERRLGSAFVAALLTGAAVGTNVPGSPYAYGAWLALGFALALLGVAALAARGALRRPAVSGGAWAVAGVGTVFVVSLFLRWETFCLPPGSTGPGLASGSCISTNGWSLPGSAAALLVLLVMGAPAAWRRRLSTGELVVGAAVLVATAGFTIPGFFGGHLAYGSYLGFAAAGLLLVIGLARSRSRPALDGRRLATRAVPVTASFLFMLAVLIPWWVVLPSDWNSEAGVLAGSWLAVAGVLLSLHLLRAWLPTVGRPPSRGRTVTLVPLALLALAIVGIVEDRSAGLTWGGGILLGLGMLLLALGWLEERQGLESLRPPELLRVDRLRLD